MKIKKDNNSKITSKLLYLPVFLLLIFLLVQAKIHTQKFNGKSYGKAANDLENPTTISTEKTYREIIENEINLIHSDSAFLIFLNNINSIPNLIYVYTDKLTERQKSDLFFVHVYIKDQSELISQNKGFKYLGLDFSGQPDTLDIENKKYYIFKKPFTHLSYKGKIINKNNVSSIQTGRYQRGLGRSHHAKIEKFASISHVEVANNFDNISLFIKAKNFNKIQNKRNYALSKGILLTSEDDLVASEISINQSKKIKSKIRLKGDWTDHLIDERKWSFRVILEDENTVDGMRKFSLQHPKVRNYHWEWLVNKVMKANDLIGLRYDFVNLTINTESKGSKQIIPVGIMAIEESFDKILIENNKRREGIILSFDESLLWNDREKQQRFNLDPTARSRQSESVKSAPIKVYNENKVLSDPVLSKQFKLAKDLLEGLRAGEIKVSEAFDIDKLTMFVAISNLFGGGHGLVWHNLRIYFNPITGKLEPISFDLDAGYKLDKIYHYPFSSGDSVYIEKLAQKIRMVSNSKFVNNVVTQFSREISELTTNLNFEFTQEFDLTVLDYNSNFLKKKINPANTIISGLLEHHENEIKIDITNLLEFPVKILGLEHKDGKQLNKSLSKSIVYPGESEIIAFKLKESFVNAFVSKKNKKGEFRYPNDVKKIRITHAILGVDLERKGMLMPFAKNPKLSEKISEYQNLFKPNFTQLDFISVNFEEMDIRFNSGKYQLDKNLVIPSGFNVTVDKGFNLDLVNNASIISHSPFQCNGTETSPIRFYSSDGSGAGIFVSSSKKKSRLDYCYFTNLSNPNTDIWNLSGSVNFHETNVEISNSVFENNRSEDALNIIRSKFSITSSSFKNTQSDAFDGDFVEGEIQKCRFLNTGNDGIDISGSDIHIKEIIIDNPSDKAISAGESSKISGENIKVSGGEIGIVSKDLSKIELSEVIIESTRLGLSSFQKKTEYGTGLIEITNLKLLNNELDYLIENGSQLFIDNIPVETVSDKVIDQMYGKEYGKSSG